MRMAQALFGGVAGLLGLVALVFTLTHQAATCFSMWRQYASGEGILVTSLTSTDVTVPAIFLGSGALLVFLSGSPSPRGREGQGVRSISAPRGRGSPPIDTRPRPV